MAAWMSASSSARLAHHRGHSRRSFTAAWTPSSPPSGDLVPSSRPLAGRAVATIGRLATRTIRAPGRVGWFGALAAVGLVAVVQSVTGSDAPHPVRLALAFAFTGACLLQARARLVAGATGLTVVNPLVTRVLPWSAVDRFEVRPGRVTAWIAVAVLGTGEAVALRGVAPVRRMRRSARPLEATVRELNQAAAAARPGR